MKKNCIQRSSLMLLMVCHFVFIASAQKRVSPVVSDNLLSSNSVIIDGLIGDRLNSSYESRILGQDVDRLIEPFRNKTETHCWQSEFWGKWFTSAVLAYKYMPTLALRKKLDHAVAELLRTQSAEGYIGNYSSQHRLDEWDIWGRKYSMLGLLAYYDITKEKYILKAVERMADHLIYELGEQAISIVNKGNYKGMAASSVLEPIVHLYKLTDNRKYLVFAESIVQQWETETGPQLISRSSTPVAKRFPYTTSDDWVKQGQKAYEMMSCYEGLLELYRITGNKLYKSAVEKTWESINSTEINILGSGSASECWYNGRSAQPHTVKHADETCVTVTWIKLSQQLLKLTGDVKYAHAIEKSYYNSLLGAMKPDGTTWTMYSPMAGTRGEGSDQCSMGLNCCIASGPRGLFGFPFFAVMTGEKDVKVNFFNAGTYQTSTSKGQSLKLVQQTNYPIDGQVNIELQLEKEENFPLSIRIPEWSYQTSLHINGEQVRVENAGEYIVISRNWKSGDKLELELDMRGRLEVLEGTPSFVSIKRGPLVLARDMRISKDVDVDEIITPLINEDGTVEISKSGTSFDDVIFSIPCLVGSWRFGQDAEPRNVYFTNYANAGSTFDSQSRYRVWLEQLIDPKETGYIK